MQDEVIGYGRVSELDYSRHVDENELDVAANQQRRRLERAGCTKIYFDVQRGTDDDRPNFQQVMNLVSQQGCRRLVITRDDRITRNVQTTLNIIETFISSNVELLILEEGDQPVDLNNPYEWKRRVQAGLDSQFEVKMLGLRVRRGYEDLRSQRRANPHPPFGYQRNRKGFYEPHPENYSIAQGIISQFLQTRSVQQTIIWLSVTHGLDWNRSRFKYWIHNEVLRGNTPRFQDKSTGKPAHVDFNTHSDIALLSAEQYLEIQNIFKENKRLWGSNHQAQRYLLSGLCRCARCDGAMSCRKKKGKDYPENYYYLDCSTVRNFGKANVCTMIHAPSCRLVEAAIIDKLTARAGEIAELANVPKVKEESPEIKELRRQFTNLQSAGDNPAIETAKKDILHQIQQLEARESQQETNLAEETLRSYGDIAQSKDFWLQMSEESKKRLYQILIDRVLIDGQKQSGKRVQYHIDVILSF